jgi:hypothetical protein
MATKRTGTKKDLEDKIAELEAKLTRLSAQLEAKPAPAPQPKPAEAPKPAPAPQPKPAEAAKPAPQPKPAETKPAVPSLEDAYRNAPMTDFHQYRAKVTGYSPAPNRYFVRRTAPVGKVPPQQSWNEQKAKVTGYTQPSNQYFATRARLAYHPADKMFTGYGLQVSGATTQAQYTAPPPKKSTARGSLPKGF